MPHKTKSKVSSGDFPGASRARQLLLTHVANIRDANGVKHFWKRWLRVLNIENDSEILKLRDGLRRIWDDPESSDSERILEAWLTWTPDDFVLAAWALSHPERNGPEPQYHMPFLCSVRESSLVPNVLSLRAMLIQGVFEQWKHFRRCANSECAAPYFIVKRRDQTVCDAGDCKAMRQREHARNWWRNNRGKKAKKRKEKGQVKQGGASKTQ